MTGGPTIASLDYCLVENNSFSNEESTVSVYCSSTRTEVCAVLRMYVMQCLHYVMYGNRHVMTYFRCKGRALYLS